ncbi:MAG: autotransporter domain-containing protein [Planctomycetaceae bacterium]|nr:autotransporter domain-containing protein [Planctomycetaceae bacterium]
MKPIIFASLFVTGLWLFPIYVQSATYDLPQDSADLATLVASGLLSSNDTIILHQDDGTLSSQLTLPLTIRSDTPQIRIIDMKNNSRFLEYFDGTVILDYINISNAVGVDYGGAINIMSATLNIEPVVAGSSGYAVFEKNRVSGTISGFSGYVKGGAISNEWGTLNITDALFTENQNHANVVGSETLGEAVGGALFNSGTMTVTGTLTFTKNQVSASSQSGATALAFGGAFYNEGEDVHIANAVFSNNIAMDGGGLFNYGIMSITNSATFTENIASRYGGALVNYDTLSLANGIFYGNSAESGGAFYNDFGTTTLINPEFNNNAASQYGGGIYNNNGEVIITVTKDTLYNENRVVSGGGFLYMDNEFQTANTVFDIANGNILTIGNSTATDRTLDSIASATEDVLLRKINAGTLVLNADNSGYIGTFEIEGGNVSISKADQIGARLGIVRFSGTESDAAHTARIQITDDIVFDSFGNDNHHLIIEAGKAGGFTVDTEKTLSITNTVSNGSGGSVTIQERGIFVLEGNGTIQYKGNTDSIGKNDINIASEAMLQLKPGATGIIEFHDSIRGTENSQVILDGAGRVLFWNTSEMAGNTTIQQGYFVLEESDGTDTAGVYGTTTSGNIEMIDHGTIVLKQGTQLNAQQLIFNGGTLEVSGTPPASETDSATINIGNGGIRIGEEGAVLHIESEHQLSIYDQISDIDGQTGVITKSGNGTLILGAENNSYHGDVNIDEGTISATHSSAMGTGQIQNEATLELLFNGTFNNDLSGDGRLISEGDIILLGNHNRHTGTADIRMGQLQFGNENILSFRSQADYNVWNGATLSGNGFIESLIIQDGGSLTPGIDSDNNKIGTIEVEKSVTFEKGSTFIVDLDAARSYQIDETSPSSDRLVVHENAAIVTDATLDISVLNSAQMTGDRRYLIIDTEDGVEGLFSNYVEKAGFGFSQEIDGNDLYLVLKTIPGFDIRGTPNARRAGYGMNHIIQSGRASELGRLYDALANLPANSDLLPEAFAQLHGEIFATGQDVVAMSQRKFLQIIPQQDFECIPCSQCCRISSDPIRRWGMFTGDFNHRRHIGPYSGYDFRTTGIAMGLENSRMLYYTSAGIVLGYENGFQHYDSIRSSGTINTFRTLFYTKLQKNDWYLNEYIGYAKNWHKTKREINIGSEPANFVATTRAKYNDDLISAGIELGRTLPAGLARVTSSLGLHYIYVATPAILETGGYEANLSVAKSNYHSLRFPLGIKFQRDFVTQRTCWTPELHAFYIAELLDEHSRVWTTYHAVPDSRAFYADSGYWGHHSVRLGMGLRGTVTKQCDVQLNYDYEFYQRTNREELILSVLLYW